MTEFKLNKGSNYLASFAVRGRSLSAAQDSLMKDVLNKFSALSNCERVFEPTNINEKKIVLEIGFGDGQNLIERALHARDKIFIGCEVYKRGLLKVASYIQKNEVSNIYLHQGDGRQFLERIPDSSLSCIYLLFPDPWPKTKQNKRRIVNIDSLKLFYRKLQTDSVFYFATDDLSYATHTLLCFDSTDFVLENLPADCPAKKMPDFLKKPSDWMETKYESRAINLSQKIYYILAKK